MIYSLLLTICLLGASIISYFIFLKFVERMNLRNIEQTTWDGCMESLYKEVDDEIKSYTDLPTLVSKYFDPDSPPLPSSLPPKYLNGWTEPIGISKHSLLTKLFGSDYKKSESWVKLYHNGSVHHDCDAYNNETLDIYICSNGDMVNVKYTEPNNSNSRFNFDLVKEGDLGNGILTNNLLTVEKDFHKLTHIVDAIMKGEFKPSDSPYDKYWLELEKVKVNGIVSDHQKVKDFFDKLDQRWYEYSAMYNDAMSGVIGFTPYDNKLYVDSGDELQKVIKNMKLNSNLESLLSVVKDDDIIKSIILERYGVEVSVDRSKT